MGHDKNNNDSESSDNLIKVRNRYHTEICLILKDRENSTCRAMAERLLDEGIKADKSTVNRDYKNPEFRRMLNQALYEIFNHEVMMAAGDNIMHSIVVDRDKKDSKWLFENNSFFPPPELIVRSRMDAPGDTEEKELLEMLTSEGGIEQLRAKLNELKSLPDEDPPEPETEPDQ